MRTVAYSLFLMCLFGARAVSYAQGPIGQLLNDGSDDLTTSQPICGAYELMENINQKHPDYLELSDEFMRRVQYIVEQNKQNRTYTDLLIVPVVFHVVYNDETENLPDEVIFNQLQILNESYRRENADTSDTREVFHPHVGDTKIEFVLATTDPDGNPTTGITRTPTDVTHFGGVLPYGPGETEEISTWVTDSLFYNMFRISNSDLGGVDAWDTDHYLNVWIGDLRILEPGFDDLEELFVLALGTPPYDHPFWTDEDLEDAFSYEDGVIIHYVCVGDGNPNDLPPPYDVLNGVVTGGKLLVHEVGHYLGLRHIWGDGDCSMGDYIDDTPNAANYSSYNCLLGVNTCEDDIDGVDLPDMIENYMDYSSEDCQNSFTIGQADVMRAVLEEYRPFLAEEISTVQLSEADKSHIHLYPNPSNGTLFINLGVQYEKVTIIISNSAGSIIYSEIKREQNAFSLEIDVAPGLYFITLTSEDGLNYTERLFIQ